MDNNFTHNKANVGGKIYVLPYRIHAAIEFAELIVFLSYPTADDPIEIRDDYERQGEYDLFCINKITNDVVWKMKGVISAFKTSIPFRKDESWFGNKDQYKKYLDEFKQREVLSVDFINRGDLVDPYSGEILNSVPLR